MAELNDKMVKADVIALDSPVNFYTDDAQLKTFLLYSDRGGFR